MLPVKQASLLTHCACLLGFSLVVHLNNNQSWESEGEEVLYQRVNIVWGGSQTTAGVSSEQSQGKVLALCPKGDFLHLIFIMDVKPNPLIS